MKFGKVEAIIYSSQWETYKSMKQIQTGRDAKVERTKRRKQKIEESKGKGEDMRERERERPPSFLYTSQLSK